jgi:two-component system, cell cycle sensor histidine kinase and response regulator CckA
MSDVEDKGSILVVDDESVVRDLISGFLTKLGYQVLLAEDGADAVKVFQQMEKPPLVMVTDIVMPKLDGPTLAKQLRESHPGLCVLFVSSYPSKKLSVSDLTKPVNGYLSKPFSLRNFAASVNKLVKVAKSS